MLRFIYGVCFVLICFYSHLLLLPREGCVSFHMMLLFCPYSFLISSFAASRRLCLASYMTFLLSLFS